MGSCSTSPQMMNSTPSLRSTRGSRISRASPNFRLRSSFLSVPHREPSGDIDHFCAGVEDFEPERVASAIREAGLENDLRVGRGSVSVRDPDGISVQVSWPDRGG